MAATLPDLGAVQPLDRPVWSALTTRQAALALGDARAVRMQADHGAFAAAADGSAENLAALVALAAPGGSLFLVETGRVLPPPGLTVRRAAECVQMWAPRLTPAPSEVGSVPGLAIVPLAAADAPEMLALATLTEPGPFFASTHRLGDFVGVKHRGRLVAMAGERLKLPGHTEVSGVCTHPDHRGKGYAGALMRVVAAGILARGEVPVLHAYASNGSAIALYEKLGFVTRRMMVMTVLAR